MPVKLVSYQGERVVRHAHKRPFYAYYYAHGVKLGYDRIGRATEKPRAISAAVRRMITEKYSHVDIYFEDDTLVAVLNVIRNAIAVRMY